MHFNNKRPHFLGSVVFTWRIDWAQTISTSTARATPYETLSENREDLLRLLTPLRYLRRKLCDDIEEFENGLQSLGEGREFDNRVGNGIDRFGQRFFSPL